MAENELRSLSAGLPAYSNMRDFMQIITGASYETYRQLVESLWEQRGNRQEQVDWINPDDWIPDRLQGAERDLAKTIWEKSGGRVNPRYIHYLWRFAKKYGLLEESGDAIRITAEGERFLQKDSDLITRIDNYEGIIAALQIVAERGTGKRGDFWDSFADFCRTYTNYRADNVIAGALYDRLMNLIERGYINRKGQFYEITNDGLSYLETVSSRRLDGKPADKQADLLRLAKTSSDNARAELADYLANMNPFIFENVIKQLLERIGYENVETTSPTNDRGVDLVADIQLGITHVREVVQVKRHRGNIGRPVLDGLRGSLHRFRAVRGTIITTGGFSRGTAAAAFEVGAAPITLIDGERLLDLLIEHGIGVRKKVVEYFEFDASELTRLESKAGDEPADL